MFNKSLDMQSDATYKMDCIIKVLFVRLEIGKRNRLSPLFCRSLRNWGSMYACMGFIALVTATVLRARSQDLSLSGSGYMSYFLLI